jgi:hypothetical protein
LTRELRLPEARAERPEEEKVVAVAVVASVVAEEREVTDLLVRVATDLLAKVAIDLLAKVVTELADLLVKVVTADLLVKAAIADPTMRAATVDPTLRVATVDLAPRVETDLPTKVREEEVDTEVPVVVVSS